MKKRLFSAAVMLPVVVTLLWVGSPYRDIFIVAVTITLLLEWNSVCYELKRLAYQKWTWSIAGSFYIVLGCYSFWTLGDSYGWLWQIYCLGAVAASDTGAYFAGKALKGPKLTPRISPNKTWSGSFGGILATMLIGTPLLLSTGTLGDDIAWKWILGINAFVSIIAQIGDLIESGAKRCLGIKDISQLIPGHGGLLDRVDGLLLVSIVAAVCLGNLSFG